MSLACMEPNEARCGWFLFGLRLDEASPGIFQPAGAAQFDRLANVARALGKAVELSRDVADLFDKRADLKDSAFVEEVRNVARALGKADLFDKRAVLVQCLVGRRIGLHVAD